MRNYNIPINLEHLVTNSLWFFFTVQAKIQLFIQNICNIIIKPVENIPAKNISEFKFISVNISFNYNDENEQNIKFTSFINLSDDDYIINNKLFTYPWILKWIEKELKNNYNDIDMDTIEINIIDNNVNNITLNKDKYIIIEKNNYIVKTI